MSRTCRFVFSVLLAQLLLWIAPTSAFAIVNQVDGTIVPQTTRLQSCLDKSQMLILGNPAPGEGAGILDAVRDASTFPQTFIPAVTAGRRLVTFTVLGEGGGFRNRFGWYNVGDRPTTPGSRNEVYGCRDANIASGCACPCNAGPRAQPPAMPGRCQRWINADTVELDFDCLRTAGLWRNGPVAFYLLTPEPVRDVPCVDNNICVTTFGAGSYCSMGLGRCVIGGACAPADTTSSRVYSTDDAINDDGNYVHFLIYASRAYTNAFYFGFEDLFRGGDNDFEDVLVRATGLTPSCTPSPEVCDGRDNNCDGMIDNGVPDGGSCGMPMGECRAGTLVCMRGAYVCTGTTNPNPEICDNLDNDCDGVVDENDPGGGGACMRDVDNTLLCRAGTLHCRGGQLRCEGGIRPGQEICDCMDNNCNGMIDEDSVGSPLCPGGGSCIACSCRTPCVAGEFPCSPGFECRGGFCVPPSCGGVMCRDNERCVENRCVDACAALNCQAGFVCRAPAGIARCVENNCYGLGCTGGQVCLNSMCVDDPCASVSCGEGQFCRAGQCIRSCGTVPCQAGQTCRNGECVADPCRGMQCGGGRRCINGACTEDRCASVSCSGARVCQDGQCIDDPCARVNCPRLGEVCVAGECVREGLPTIEAPDRVVSSGGGCSVRTGSMRGQNRSAATVLTITGILLMIRRRGKTQSKPQNKHKLPKKLTAVVAGALLSAFGQGCQTEPFCLNCQEIYIPPVDALATDTSRPPMCASPMPEVCDGRDNDCNGLIDDGFDLQNDRRNCGACMNECALPRAIAGCMMGRCRVGTCDIGYYDIDRDPNNGCEYQCIPSGVRELCDGRDNDCNGQIDEGLNRMTDINNCGMCGVECRFTRATPMCVMGMCAMGACEEGYVDLDRNPNNGCEYACRATAEVCDGRDNDCDGMIDEDCLRASPAMDVRLDRAGAAANSVRPVIAGDNAAVVGVAYMDRRNGASDVYFSRSADDGVNWAAEVRLDRDAAGARDSMNPVLAFGGAMNTRMGAIWGDFRSGAGNREVWTTFSDDRGATVGAESRGNGTSTGDAFNIRVAVLPTGAVVAVWEELLPDRSRVIRFARSSNARAPWTDGRLDHAPANRIAQAPSIAAGQGNDVYVAWHDNRNGLGDVFLSRSLDGGATWMNEVRADSDAMGSHDSQNASVAADTAGNVYVAWQDVRTGRSFDLYVRSSTDRAASFAGPDRRIDTAPGDLDSFAPIALALPMNRAVVLWQDFRAGRLNVFANFTRDQGATWAMRDVLVMGGSPGRSNAFDLSASAAGNLVVAAWSDDRSGRRDIYANFSLDGGQTFQPQDVRMDTGMAGGADSETPSVYAAHGIAHVVWVDRRNDQINGDIYYRALRP